MDKWDKMEKGAEIARRKAIRIQQHNDLAIEAGKELMKHGDCIPKQKVLEVLNYYIQWCESSMQLVPSDEYKTRKNEKGRWEQAKYKLLKKVVE